MVSPTCGYLPCRSNGGRPRAAVPRHSTGRSAIGGPCPAGEPAAPPPLPLLNSQEARWSPETTNKPRKGNTSGCTGPESAEQAASRDSPARPRPAAATGKIFPRRLCRAPPHAGSGCHAPQSQTDTQACVCVCIYIFTV